METADERESTQIGKVFYRVDLRLSAVSILLLCSIGFAAEPKRFDGKHFSGAGDVEYIALLETSRRMFEPDPRWQNLSMLYEPSWNGLVEGPTWDAWWIQNSYGGLVRVAAVGDRAVDDIYRELASDVVRRAGGRQARG
jgi:hypothetical protein